MFDVEKARQAVKDTAAELEGAQIGRSDGVAATKEAHARASAAKKKLSKWC